MVQLFVMGQTTSVLMTRNRSRRLWDLGLNSLRFVCRATSSRRGIPILQACVLISRQSLFYYPAGDPDPRNANLFSCMDRADHAEKRRKLSPAFSMSAIIQMESMVEESSKLLENHLLRFTKTGELLNFTHWTFCYAFDVIAQLTVRAHHSCERPFLTQY